MSSLSGGGHDFRRVAMHNAFNEAYGSQYSELAELAGAGVDLRDLLGILKHLQGREYNYAQLGEQGRQFDVGAGLKTLLGGLESGTKAGLMQMQIEGGKYESPLLQQKQKQDDAMAYARKYMASHSQGSLNDPSYAYYFGLLKNAQDLKKGIFGTSKGWTG